MFLLDWFWNLLFQLGFFKKKATILLLGLDNSGKTTLLHKLKYGTVHLVIPTQRAKLEEISFNNIIFQAWDLGGHSEVRNIWKDFFFEADAIIFMIDVSDIERIPEAKQELYSLLYNEYLLNVPFVILGNKIDIKGSLNYEQLKDQLELNNLLNSSLSSSSNVNQQESKSKRNGVIKIFECSLIENIGYKEALNWLSNEL
jgi:GTP-binding protein SAR1